MKTKVTKSSWEPLLSGIPRRSVDCVTQKGGGQTTGLFRCWTDNGKIITYKNYKNNLEHGVSEGYDEVFHALEDVFTFKSGREHGVILFLFYDFQDLPF